MATAVTTPSAGEEIKTAPPTVETPEQQIPAAAPLPDGTTPVVETPAVEAEETEINLDETPEGTGDFAKYKPLIKQDPTLRPILGQHQAFKELQGDQPFSEFREIHQIVPTLDDAQKLVAEAETARSFGETFRSNPEKFFESLRKTDGNAYQAAMRDLPNFLRKMDGNLFSEQARQYTNHAMANAYAWARSTGNEDVTKAIEVMAQIGVINLGAGFAGPKADETEADRLRKQLEDRDRQDSQSQATQFWSQTDDVIVNGSVTEIEWMVVKAFPDATKDDKEDIVREIWEKTKQAMGNQPQFTAQLEKYRDLVQRGKTGISEHKEIVNFALGRTKRTLPVVAKPIIDKWSRRIISKSTEKIEKRTNIAATTRDIGTGSGSTAPVASNGQPAKGPRTQEQIFAEIRQGTYQPKN